MSSATTRTQRIDTDVLRKLEALIEKETSLRGSITPHSQHEAEATARAIQRLVLRHHLSLSDVELLKSRERNPVDAEIFSPEEHGLRSRRRRVFWQEELAAIVAEAHLCGLLVVPGSNVVFFVGRNQDRKACMYAFSLLSEFAEKFSAREAGRIANSPGGSPTRKAAYSEAWLRGFNLRIAQRYRDAEEQMIKQALDQNSALARLPGGTGITGMSLMCRLPDCRNDVQEWIAANVGNPTADLVRPPVHDAEGLAAGFRAGAQAPLRHSPALER